MHRCFLVVMVAVAALALHELVNRRDQGLQRRLRRRLPISQGLYRLRQALPDSAS